MARRNRIAIAAILITGLCGGCTAGRCEVWSVATRGENEYVETDGRADRTIAIRRSGAPDAPLTLIFLHGLAQTKYSMRDVGRALSRDHQVVLVDLLGHGDSDKPIDHQAGLYSMSRQGQRVAEIIDREIAAGTMQRVVLVGLSYGGGIALEAARLYFERNGDANPIAGVVVLAPGCYHWAYWDSPEFAEELLFLKGSMLLPFATVLAHDLVFEITVLERSYWRKDRISEEDRREIRQQYRSVAARVAAARATLDMADELESRRGQPRFGRITCPILCLYGEFDDYVAPSVIATLEHEQATNPEFEYIEIKDAGHDLPGEKRYEVIRAIRAFAEDLQ